MLECPFLPPMLVASIYLKTGIGGAAPYNLELLRFVGQATSVHRLPWILGGDFQMSPDAINKTLFPQTARAQILADDNPMGTCRHAFGVSTIDFFIVSDDLASAAQSAAPTTGPCASCCPPTQAT